MLYKLHNFFNANQGENPAPALLLLLEKQSNGNYKWNKQSIQWVCPWLLWNLLMSLEPIITEDTELNRWEKLLSYMESSRLQQSSIFEVGELIDTLWASVGIPLTWQQVLQVGRRDFQAEIGNWQWWINWISLKAFLARQERERQKFVVSALAPSGKSL